LDERVVNPFFHDKRIPSSRGPYLSTFRRSVRFVEATRSGLRDRKGYDALLELISYLERADDALLRQFIHYLLYLFAKLREASTVPLSRLHRISLEQYRTLFSNLLGTPSGGRLPVILVVATFRAIKEFFGLDWQIEFQGINVADAAAGTGADVTVSTGGRIVLAAEITERPVGRARVVSTFNTKIALHGIEDYLFFIGEQQLDEDVLAQTRQYFAQGHEVNFVQVKEWILMSLATIGRRGREVFNRALLEMLDDPELPRLVKVAWNAQVGRLVGQ
jgi:hypothetical protein